MNLSSYAKPVLLAYAKWNLTVQEQELVAYAKRLEAERNQLLAALELVAARVTDPDIQTVVQAAIAKAKAE